MIVIILSKLISVITTVVGIVKAITLANYVTAGGRCGKYNKCALATNPNRSSGGNSCGSVAVSYASMQEQRCNKQT